MQGFGGRVEIIAQQYQGYISRYSCLSTFFREKRKKILRWIIQVREDTKLVRKAGIENLEEAAELAVLMWNENTVQELVDEFSALILKGNAQFFLKYHQDMPVGFAQCQLRYDYVEGTDTSPVGYLEGIFIREEHRHKGYAKELLSECEKWAKQKGCKEFASDCEIDNESSLGFHRALGFEEANRIICFTKKLTTP